MSVSKAPMSGSVWGQVGGPSVEWGHGMQQVDLACRRDSFTISLRGEHAAGVYLQRSQQEE